MTANALQKNDYVQDNVRFAEETWEIKRRDIAEASEAACNLPGNMGAPDMEEFVLKYSLRFAADFA